MLFRIIGIINVNFFFMEVLKYSYDLSCGKTGGCCLIPDSVATDSDKALVASVVNCVFASVSDLDLI